MKYGSHIPFLERELHALSARPFDLSLQSFLEVFGGKEQEEGDAAVRVFARTLLWPPLSDRARLDLCCRLSCALAWCRECAEQDSIARDGTEWLESVCIDYWQDVGRQEWIAETFCDAE